MRPRGDRGQSGELYDRAWRVRPGAADAFRALERTYRQTERWDALVELYERKAQLTEDAPLAVSLLRTAAWIYEEQLHLAHQLTTSGQYLAGAPLHPPSTATRVRVRDGTRLVTDGPFAETREHLGGYMLIDVPDRNEAIAIAARGAVARVGTVEIRRVREGPPT